MSTDLNMEYQEVKFGDICREVKLTTKDPIADGYDKYIGLEHLDSGSLKIKRWGLIAEDNPTFTRVFKKGHILIGKRRPYLKKAAIAEFDGICSGDIIVVESSDSIYESFLIHLIHTESFWDWAVKHSSGSLSPRTKFSLLKEYVCKVPNKEHISAFAKKVERLVKLEEIYISSSVSLNDLKNIMSYKLMLLDNSFHDLFIGKYPILKENWKLDRLSSVLSDIQYGLSEEMSDQGDYPVLRMGNLSEGKVIDDNLKYINLDADDLEKYKLHQGDILFNRTNSMDWVGKVAQFELEGDYVFASYLLRLNTNERIFPSYLNRYLNLPIIQYRLKAYATPGVSQANINPTSIRNFPILLPPIEEQEKIEKILSKIDLSLEKINSQLTFIRAAISHFRDI